MLGDIPSLDWRGLVATALDGVAHILHSNGDTLCNLDTLVERLVLDPVPVTCVACLAYTEPRAATPDDLPWRFMKLSGVE